MDKLVMGYWDCPVCGKKEIRGDVISCPSCGRARGDVQFYLKGYEDQEILSNEEADQLETLSEEEAENFTGRPDWYCSFCNSLNSDRLDKCGTCGASRADSEANYFEMLAKKKEKEAAELAAQPKVPEDGKKKRSRLFAILAVIVVAVVGLVAWMNARKTGDWEVTGISWERNVQIEEYRLVEESSMSYPADAEEGSISQREVVTGYIPVQVGTRPETRTTQVPDGEVKVGERKIDNGDGTFSFEPVYETKYRTETYTVDVPVYVQQPLTETQYTYRAWRWKPSRIATASGTDHETAWPDLDLAENEREAEKNSRSELYRFTARSISGEDKTVAYRMKEDDWMKISTGDLLHISVKNSGGGAYLCDADGNKIADLQPDK